MNAPKLKLLYLGFAFPPGVQALYPGINPAGHMLETNLVAQLGHSLDIRSVGLLPFVPPLVTEADPKTGIAHHLVLVEAWPELWSRTAALSRLKQFYRTALKQGWNPDLVLVYNLSPIYNQFLRWLKRQSKPPKLVLLLLDSPNLGETLPRLKRFRRRFKPMYVPDSEMLPVFDACIGLSKAVERYFGPRGIPFLWMPGACVPARAIRTDNTGPRSPTSTPVRFGYYGALGAHAGVMRMVNVFTSDPVEATLEICGYGKAAEEIKAVAQANPRVIFRGLLSPDECLKFGRDCDVLVNPRPATHGNENNFASKVFDYALSGRAILTSRISGVEEVLGPSAYYFEATDFESGLGKAFQELSITPRTKLHQRGNLVQEHILSQYSWQTQGQRAARFLSQIASSASP